MFWPAKVPDFVFARFISTYRIQFITSSQDMQVILWNLLEIILLFFYEISTNFE